MKNFKTTLSFILPLILLFAYGITAYAEENPYPKDAPWPVMRGDLKNTGRSVPARWQPVNGAASEVRRFHTGNGIFSTPVMDGHDRIYVGSADHYFYALDPVAGKELWRFKTGEIIDSAAAIGSSGAIYFGAGDSNIYALNPRGEKLWSFDVLKDRPRDLFSLSTNYWWEGNVVIGPDGALYAGSDDFFFYCIETSGKLRWAFRTGLFIWAAAGFDNNAVYVASFDMNLYALDQKTGRLKWKTDLKNPLVASPAISDDGVIFQASMDGKLHAIDAKTGRIKWAAQTRGHVYSSAAIAKDGTVYITSADGMLYAFDAASGKTKWTFYTGDALRSSPALGPDPEARAQYLVYFGGGEGMVYAIDPQGQRRWSFDTLFNSATVDYPNINASPALGKSGLAVATASGDVIYIPYDYYLKKEAAGIVRDPSDGFAPQGAAWYYISTGGLIDRKPVDPLNPAKPLTVNSRQIINLRFLARESSQIIDARLKPGFLQIQASPGFKYRMEFQGDGRTISIVPEEFLKPGSEYVLKVSADYTGADAGNGKVSAALRLATEKGSETNPIISGQIPGFQITHMAIPLPPIVPSLDQIGIASTKIPFVILETDPARKSFLAWSVQRFGETETGELVGVPDQRSLLYAFSGTWDQDGFMMESKNIFMEATGFPMPLDSVIFSGRALADGTVAKGASLLVELKPKSKMQALGALGAVSGGGGGESGQNNFFASLIKRGGIGQVMKAAAKTVPAGLKMITRRVWKDWGFYNQDHKFVGVGTFRMSPLSQSQITLPEGIELKRFAYIPAQKKVVAELGGTSIKKNGQQIIFSILLVDIETGKPLPIDYNSNTLREKTKSGARLVTLPIPKGIKLRAGGTRAYLMAELQPLNNIEF